MGADGWVYILDARVVKDNGWNPKEDFHHAYKRVLFGRKIWTVYGDTERCYGMGQEDTEHSVDDYHQAGAVLDEWRVWS